MTDPALDLFVAHVEKIRCSEVLRRSDVLRRLFDFLVERTLADRPPKEIEIAIDVYDKDANFEGTQSAMVRVSIHKLRRKLDEYYAENPDSSGRLVMPLGAYRLVFDASPTVATAVPDLDIEPEPAADVDSITAAAAEIVAVTKPSARAAALRFAKPGWLLIGILALLTANLAMWFRAPTVTSAVRELATVRNSALWSAMLDDNLPIYVVLGDYYIFAELDDSSMEIRRLVREFNINSRHDLERFLKNNPNLAGRYMDVALQYLPISTANALQAVIPLLESGNKNSRQIQIILTSDLTPDILKSAHVVYIGLLSGMGMLGDAAFRDSRFSIGDSYDELIDKRTQLRYVSQAATVVEAPGKYRDFGYFSSVDGPGGNRIVILAGTRDVAVMHMAEVLTQPQALKQLLKQAGAANNFEALYAVEAIDRTTLSGRLLLTGALNPSAAAKSEAGGTAVTY